MTPAAWAYRAEQILGGRVEYRSGQQRYALYDWFDSNYGYSGRPSGAMYNSSQRYLRFQKLVTEEELISLLVEKRMGDG